MDQANLLRNRNNKTRKLFFFTFEIKARHIYSLKLEIISYNLFLMSSCVS